MLHPSSYRFTSDPFFKRLFILIFMVVMGYVLYQLQSVIWPFVVAFVLSYAVNPLVQKLQDRLKIRRWVAILLVDLSTSLVFGLSVWWLVPLVWDQV